MSRNDTDNVIKEYLDTVQRLVADLPLMQRRELLADLESHIAAERIDRDAQSEPEILQILERLGSPEVVAAAAREEAPMFPAPHPQPSPHLQPSPLPQPSPQGAPSWDPQPGGGPRRRLTPMVIAVACAAVAVTVIAVVCLGLFLFSPSDSSPAIVPAPVASVPLVPPSEAAPTRSR